MSDQATEQQQEVIPDQPASTPSEQQKVETPAPDVAEKQGEKSTETKTFTQEELSEIVKREKAKAEAKAERRVIRQLKEAFPQQQVQQPVMQEVDTRPRRDMFNDDEAFIDALTDWKLEQRESVVRRSQVEASQQSLVTKTENLYKEAAKLPGFDRDEFEQLPLTPVIAQALIDSDAAPKLMAYMAANPEEVERIATLSPARQAAELGKLEIKVSSAPVKTTSAPSPINPVGAGKGRTASDPASMSMDEYIQHRMKHSPVWRR